MVDYFMCCVFDFYELIECIILCCRNLFNNFFVGRVLEGVFWCFNIFL